MKTRLFLAATILCLLALPLSASQADYKLWYSPLTATTFDDAVTIEPYQGQPSSILITSSETGDKWVSVGLTCSSNAQIDSLTVCYEMNNDTQSYISAVRLTTMTIPYPALIIHDDGADQTDPGPRCYVSNVGGESVEGTITFWLRMYFASTEDSFNIGAIALHFSEPLSDVIGDTPRNDGNLLQLKQNQPNPFGLSTTIEYALDRAGMVEVNIHDVTGRQLRTLVDTEQSPGSHHVVWDGRSDEGHEMPSGKYYYHVRIDEQIGSKGMLLLR